MQNIHPSYAQHISSRHTPELPNKRSTWRHIRRRLVFIVVVVGFVSGLTHVAAQIGGSTGPVLRSGVIGYCMDVQKNSVLNGAVVDSWGCNGTSAQLFSENYSQIHHTEQTCLSVKADQTTVGAPIVIEPCQSNPGQIWFSDQGGLFNPSSGLCIGMPSEQTAKPLGLASCARVATTISMQWTSSENPNVLQNCSIGSEGQQVACHAVHEWSVWQTSQPSHNSLLKEYSDGNGYEEWCADFVSYVYKESGHAFNTGERDGWDEYNANNFTETSFTEHQAGSYVPKPGDIAFFDYPGGHVELVVSGGVHPTFVYGDSATTDPATGNGEMAANTLLSDGDLGSVQYYLSPPGN